MSEYAKHVINKLVNMPGIDGNAVFAQFPRNERDLEEYARCVDAVMSHKRPSIWNRL